QQAGRLMEFYDRIVQGVCLEGRIRDIFNWTVTLSEIKPFHEFMQNAIADYLAYQQVMEGQDNVDAAQVSQTRQFILSRHRDLPCQIHPEYAPKGIITASGITKYLKEVLYYEEQRSCIIS